MRNKNSIVTTARIKRLLFRETKQKCDRLKRIAANYQEYRQRKMVNLEPSEAACNLAQNGYSIFQPPSEKTVSLLAHSLARFDKLHPDDMVIQEGKKFYRECLNRDDYEPSTPFMQYALDESTLRSVGKYLGFLPYLQSIELIHSTPSNEPLNRTHFFHRDLVDKRIVKIFTYITDVDETCGPLTVMPLPAMKAAPWSVRTMPGFLTDDELAGRIDWNDAVKFTGPAGSVMMVDTKNLLHLGSRCTNPRLTFVAHYNSGFGYYPRYDYHRWNDKDYRLSTLQRLALGGGNSGQGLTQAVGRSKATVNLVHEGPGSEPD